MPAHEPPLRGQSAAHERAPGAAARDPAVDLAGERQALERARLAAADKLARVSRISGGGADALADEYIDAVVAGTVEKLRQELVVFGRVDDDRPWRIGLYGIDDAGGDQLVVDWRAPFAGRFYQATFDDPRGLVRRVSYVGCIDDLMVEDFASGTVAGTSPLMAELSRSRGPAMRTAVATLQSEQDRLVRLPPEARLVLRGGPGTGKTVVGLHRAAWLVYNDRRITADRVLVIGPSDRFLRFVSAVLPTLGEARITQTTFDRLIGSTPDGGPERDAEWLAVLDRFVAGLHRPASLRVGRTRIAEAEVAALLERLAARSLSWRDRRRALVDILVNRYDLVRREATAAIAEVLPPLSVRQALARLRADGLDPDHGALADEVRARIEGVPARYSHVIVDEAQDMSLLQLRAVRRRADGLTLVGDDAQRSRRHGLPLREAARMLDVDLEQMATAYRMSAEIAAWLNGWAERHGIEAVTLDGIRPTGIPVIEVRSDGDGARGVPEDDGPAGVGASVRRLRHRWPNVATISADDVGDHKGVEYDGVVVDARAMEPAEVYLAASRAAHELVVHRAP
jgi:hypothetical protein